MPTLLLECFSEEMPARMQFAAAEQLVERVAAALKQARLEHGDVKHFVSPRHLAVQIEGLPEQQPDISVERKGPKVGAPEQAMAGFLKSVGLSVDQLEQRDTGKGVFYFAVKEEKGVSTQHAIKPLFEKVLHDFAWPKSMRWGSHDCQWVRPLHSLICMLDDCPIPLKFHHITASNITYGHRFLAPDAIELSHANEYEAALEKAQVIVCREKRKAAIIEGANSALNENGLTLQEDAGLLEEVVGLVEMPFPKVGKMDDDFLRLPPEVLTSEMREHQKYFAMHLGGKFSAHYLYIANVPGDGDGDAITHGNNRVLRARLSDGAFYWDADRGTPLSEWAEKLELVTFHAKLGTTADKVARMKDLAGWLALHVPHANLVHVGRGAELAKADLVTGMVGEFPDLQGVMGRYYAMDQGEPQEVADAIAEHYLPRGASDDLPQTPAGIALALSDKLDTLAGLFAIGDAPTGSKDPYALRRAALGVLRMMLAHGLRMSLPLMVDQALKQYPAKLFASSMEEVSTQLQQFFIDRLKVMLKGEGLTYDVIEAAAKVDDEIDVSRIVARARALQSFVVSEDGSNLLAACERAGNIVSAEEKKSGEHYDGKVNEGRLSEAAEKALYTALETAEEKTDEALQSEAFTDAMTALSQVRMSVDAFFENVMVNVDEEAVRTNRLCLLNRLRKACNQVAAFDVIEG